MVGDEVTVLYVDKSHGTLNTPERFKDYVVIGRLHRQPENWEGPDADTIYYVIEPLSGYSDKETLGRMLAGGGRKREEHLYPIGDSWMLRKGFLRGELEEEPNEIARTLSKARKHGVGTRFSKAAIKANPQRFRKYTRDKYLKENNQPGLNPELKVDDIIRVIDVDGEHGRMPERFGVYKVVKVGTAYPLMTRRNRGHDAYYDIEPYPEPEISDIFSLSDTLKMSGRKTLYRGDSWVYAKEPKPITEQEQPGLSPELTYGDTILVVDIDKERESGKTTYTTPGEQMRPEKYVPYTVVDKETNGSKSKWPFRYTLVPEGQLEAYEKSLDRGWGNYEGYEKLLYPWIYEWIYANTSMANKVDRLTINEQGFSWDGTYANEIDEVNGADTSWANDDDKITLQDILDLTKHIKIVEYPTEKLAKVVLNWDDNPEEIERISQVEVSQQYPILIMVNEDNEILWVLDGNHRAQKALINNIDSIPAKLIKPSDLDERSIKMFFPKGIPTTNQTISEQDEPGFDEFSDAELEKRRTYDDFSDDEKAEIDQERIDTTPFTPLEIRILKTLHKNFDRSELQTLSTNTPEAYGNLDKKFWNVMKLFGIEETNTEQNTRESRYAKWALDNWNEEGDYNIENPIKVPLKWYGVDREESGSQVEYKIGQAEVLGFDSDDAGERADYDFYAWGGEMETNDYGDYESYDSEITNSNFIKLDEGLSRVLREGTKPQTQELLFNFWKKVGPTLDPNKLKLIGFNMDNNDDKRVVWDNLREYYGDEELTNIIQERLDGLHDSWNYEYIVTDFSFHGDEIYLNALVNGDTQVPMTQEEGGAIDMSLWDINKKAAEDNYHNYYDDIYDEARDSVSDDIKEVLLKDLPVDADLEYLDISEPGSFETYVKENELEIIREEDDGYIDDYVGTPEVITESKINDLVWSEKPTQKHKKRMEKEFGKFEGFPIDDFMSTNPPKNDSEESMDELMLLDSLPVIEEFVDTTDDIFPHFEKYFKEKDLEFPEEELKDIVKDTSPIILKLKYHYNRPRPQQLANAKGLKFHQETLDSSKTPSYPSGHATQGRLIANILGDKYPEHKSEISKLGNEIGTGRLVAKVHYPSDDLFGKELGNSLYNFIKDKEIVKEELDIKIVDDKHKYKHKDYDKFISYVIDELNIELPPTVYVEKEPSSDYTGGTYRYKGGDERIKVRSKGRSLMDILRSLAHELVHHKQKEDGRFKDKEVITDIPEIGGVIEDEANAIAGRLIKKYGKKNKDLYEQVMVKKGDVLKSDIFKFLSNRYKLYSTEYSAIKDNEGNHYQIIDIENPYEPVTLSDIIEPVVEFVSYGIESNTFKNEDIQKGIEAVTDWISLSMNQKKDLTN